MKTPYFLINENGLNENIAAFQNALQKLWPNSNLSYSVKTNSLPWILKYMKEKDGLAEVVSDEEYQLAKLCGYADNQIVFNGPIKGEKQFASAVTRGAYINKD
jgi:diaminopimelate decarboxylase